jgi:hypothetical protein
MTRLTGRQEDAQKLFSLICNKKLYKLIRLCDNRSSKRRTDAKHGVGQMIAYFHKARGKGNFELTICAQPCNGAEFQAGERIAVSGKREALAICKARGIKPWNF